MRSAFENRFPSGHPLRELASDIATYPCKQARSDCFFSASPPPCNFLANGETNAYKPLTPVLCPLEIATWKFPGGKINCCLAQGFHENSPSNKGLAMLFDPLVDAALHANTATGSTVIVLSDYGAIYDIDLIGYSGKDWGEDEAWKILHPPMPKGRINPRQVSTTLVNLWNCLCEGTDWQTQPEHIESAIRKENVLIWNFMPFMRGGSASTSNAALPDPKCKGWLQTCINWLGDFVDCVAASQIVICVNKDMMIPIKNGGSIPIPNSTFAAALPGISLGKLKRFVDDNQVFVSNHPCSWNRKTGAEISFKDCPTRREILNQRPYKPSHVLDLPVDE